MKKKKLLAAILAGFFVVSFMVTAAHAKFPDKPIQLIVQYSPGGTTDLSLRILASIAGEYLGQPVVVVNKPGGSGAVAYGILKNTKPDGYSIGGISYSGSVIAPHIRKVPFDTKNDFDFVLQFADYFQGIAVKADAPWNTLKEYLEYARKNPGKATYATAGANSGQFLTMEIIAKQAGVKLKHIPYKGGTPAVAACLGGHVQGVAAAEIPEQAKAGKMKILAIFGEQKAEAFKDVPTLKELGYKVQLTFWLGIVGPKGIAPERLEILQNAFKKAMEAKSFHKLLQRFEMTPTYKSGKDFKAMVFNHYDAMKKVIEDMGMARK